MSFKINLIAFIIHLDSIIALESKKKLEIFYVYLFILWNLSEKLGGRASNLCSSLAQPKIVAEIY